MVIGHSRKFCLCRARLWARSLLLGTDVIPSLSPWSARFRRFHDIHCTDSTAPRPFLEALVARFVALNMRQAADFV